MVQVIREPRPTKSVPLSPFRSIVAAIRSLSFSLARARSRSFLEVGVRRLPCKRHRRSVVALRNGKPHQRSPGKAFPPTGLLIDPDSKLTLSYQTVLLPANQLHRDRL